MSIPVWPEWNDQDIAAEKWVRYLIYYPQAISGDIRLKRGAASQLTNILVSQFVTYKKLLLIFQVQCNLVC